MIQEDDDTDLADLQQKAKHFAGKLEDVFKRTRLARHCSSAFGDSRDTFDASSLHTAPVYSGTYLESEAWASNLGKTQFEPVAASLICSSYNRDGAAIPSNYPATQVKFDFMPASEATFFEVLGTDPTGLCEDSFRGASASHFFSRHYNTPLLQTSFAYNGYGLSTARQASGSRDVRHLPNVYAEPNFGSLGHPELCNRPCLFFAGGSCANGNDCTFCHLHHPGRQTHLDKRNRLAFMSMSLQLRKTIVWSALRSRARQFQILGLLTEILSFAEVALGEPVQEAVVHARVFAALVSMSLTSLFSLLAEYFSNEADVDKLKSMIQEVRSTLP
jgi:hypothetical protein